MRMQNSTPTIRGIGLLDVMLLVGSIGLVAWGGVYLGHFGGRFAGDEFDAVPSVRVVNSGAPAVPESPEFKRGRVLFVNCAACHGARGEGDEGKGFPPLDKSEWVTAAGPARLLRILLHAVEGPIKVAGKDYDNAGMLPWGTWPPEDLSAIATYIRQAWSNKAGPVSVADVKAVIGETQGRTDKWKALELEKIPVALAGAAGATGGDLTPEKLKAALKALPPEKLKELLKALGN